MSYINQNSTFQWAQYYAAHWRAIPILLHYVADWVSTWDADAQQHIRKPVCSCKQGVSCAQPGKHPFLGWRMRPMDTPEEGLNAVADLIARHPRAALALRTGPESGLLVVDVDIKPNKRGDLALLEGLAKHNIEPYYIKSTLTQYTGGGGLHYIFKYPKKYTIPTISNHPLFSEGGVDIKGVSGIFNVHPSLHKSGNYYAFDGSPAVERILEAPDELVQLLAKQDRYEGAPDLVEAYTPTFHELKDLAASLKTKRADSILKEIGAEFEKALNGEPVFLNSSAHDGFVKIMYQVAQKWPLCDTDTILDMFRPCIDARMEKKADASTNLSNLRDALDSAKKKAQEDLARWTAKLLRNENGKIVACLANCDLFLKNDPFKDAFLHEARFGVPSLKTDIPNLFSGAPRILNDSDITNLTIALQNKHKIPTLKTTEVSQALEAVARTCGETDMFREWILNVPLWDRVPRLYTFMQQVAGTPDDEWIRTIFPIWFRGAVRRFLEPGYKQDTMLILEGDQGFQKSSFFKALLPYDYLFSDSIQRLVLDEANLRLLHSGPAIFEISELAAFSRSSREDLKAFLSATHDSVRPLYHQSRIAPRRFILVGSTNEDEYLDDATGNRRFLPVKVTRPIDTAFVRTWKEQLYAEAQAGLLAGFPDYITYEIFQRFQQVQKSREYGSSWLEIIRDHLDDPARPVEEISVRALLTNVLGLEERDLTRRREMDVADCLKKLGWHKSQDRNGRKIWRRS